jgi:hypothetical protein
VLPVAMMPEAISDSSIVTLARKLPSQIAGQTRLPASSRAASAIPEGGQTAVA